MKLFWNHFFHLKWKKAAMKRRAQERKAQKKLQTLTKFLNPIEFPPKKEITFHGKLGFSSQVTILKQLGLWDFTCLDIGDNLRRDLIVQLIATYNSRCSYVSGFRIGVNRADLARALKLPVKKKKDIVIDIEESKEAVLGFIEEFVLNFVILQEDGRPMPPEVLNFIRLIKEGQLEKLDWPSLFWYMVERELKAAPYLGDCFYAPHMQFLIQFQKKELLREIKVKEYDSELSLSDEDDMYCEESEGDNEPQNVQSHLDGRRYIVVGGVRCYRRRYIVLGGVRCYRRVVPLGDDDMVEEKKQEKCEEGEMREMGEGEEKGKDDEHEDEQQHEQGLPISPKGDDLEGVHSTNLLEGMKTADPPFITGEFLVSRVDAHTVPAVAETSFLSKGKRVIDHENGISHNSLNVSNKRLRTDGQCDKSSEFDMCMDQMQHWAEKARMLYAAKEQACRDSSMHQKVLLNELLQRENAIEHLQKAKYEEQHKREMEVYRLERDLNMKEDLLGGYRKDLKETNRTFAEYRARCPLPDEPLYKDAGGSGGLVLSTRETEKQRLKQEEEERINRVLIENKSKDFEAGWREKFDAHKDAVSIPSSKLIDADNEVKLPKELCNRKVSGDPNERGMSSQ